MYHTNADLIHESLIQTKNESEMVKTQPSLLESLPPEARNHIVEFLPPRDALVVSRVSSLWLGHVRYCSAVWAGTLQRRFPISFGRIQAELADAKALRGGYLAYGEGVDYVQALSRLSRERYGAIDSDPNACVVAEKKSQGCCSTFFSRWGNSKQYRILILGVEHAGKTALLNYMCDGKMGATTSTMGFNVNIATHKAMSFVAWDIGGKQQIQPLWKHYYQNTDAIIYVIDAKDEERLDEACQVLADRLLSSSSMKGIPILFMLTKRDLSETLTNEQILSKLKGLIVDDNRLWRVQGCSAENGKGVEDGLDWLSIILK